MNHSIELVVFDWAGTTVDYGSQAPAAAFRNVFAEHGVEVTDAEARAPMGLNKRQHLIAMLNQPRVDALWKSVHGRPWNDGDVDQMYHEFMPLQLKTIAQHCELVPGLVDAVNELRAIGCKIAGTTGYFREAADTVANHAAGSGFKVDVNVCADDVEQGRPAPWMIYRAMELTRTFPPSAVLNIGDTIADIQAGVNAGCWSVGVCDSSSIMGLSQQDYNTLPDHQRAAMLQDVAKSFQSAGSHATLASISQLPALVRKINRSQDFTPSVIDLPY
jgi:phosphonoacetaldehyde hydrolase